MGAKTKEEYIIEALTRSGFHLEDRVASIFETKTDADIIQSHNYTDWQTEKLRELDLYITLPISPYPIGIDLHLLIQCKQLPGNAWVFIKKKDGYLITKSVVSIWDNWNTQGRQKQVVEIITPLFTHNEINCDTYSNRYRDIILDKRKSNKKENNIRSTIIELEKALYYEETQSEELNNQVRSWSKATDHIEIFYPMIVFEGDMYEAIMTPQPTIKKITSAHVYNFSIQNKVEKGTVIDIIHIDNLEHFIDNTINKMVTILQNNEKKVRSDYRELISTFTR